jgi:hypothetical protein
MEDTTGSSPTGPTSEELKRALKAFRKRLKLSTEVARNTWFEEKEPAEIARNGTE